jgi:RNA 3'-terminal phosphate cyclase
MVIPFASLAGDCVFTVPEFTLHMKSALYVVEKILGVGYRVERLRVNLYRVEI